MLNEPLNEALEKSGKQEVVSETAGVQSPLRQQNTSAQNNVRLTYFIVN